MFAFEQLPIFACPIYKVKIDPSSYDKEQILTDIKYNYSLSSYRNSPLTGDECNIHHSYLDFENENFKRINYDTLFPIYKEIVKQFLTEVYPISTSDTDTVTPPNPNQRIPNTGFNWKCEIINYTCIKDGQWLIPHTHLPSDDFAIIHYLNLKSDHVRTRFWNPADFSNYLKSIQPTLFSKLNTSKIENSYMFDCWIPPADEDDFVIYPAALKHDIPIQTHTDEPRISIVSNIQIN